MLKQLIAVTSLLFASVAAHANTLKVEFELPSFTTGDYHKPYVAIWAESKAQNQTLLLWHLTKRKEDKWLVDIRRWWRKQGRYGDTPDGVTGATKGPGKYSETLDVGDLSQFKLFIEVVREDGGRSLLKTPIDFSDNQERYHLNADKEIGAVTIIKGK
ncbi:DUF2271 domain-containing protein [Pseudoalteromonas spongiae]|uniref:DUF2271 domain-containing protein n=1 Tax=Pseudoalteromonas spongiae TaxID=298657 RepID=UPI0037365432